MPAQPSRPRLFVSGRLAADEALALDRAQAHYLGHVMRLKPGDEVLLFNGRDGEWLAAINGLGKGGGAVVVGERTRPQAAEPGPWLAFAPVKKTGTDFIVEKATELGATRLLPVFTKHTNSARINRDRLALRAREAAEQSSRLSVPEIAEPQPLDRLIADWPEGRRLLVLDETGGGRPIAQVLTGLGAAAHAAAPPLGFLSGPEGGFDAGELDALRKLDFVIAVGLGPRVLRAETAALAALACWQAWLGVDG
jgi:16S rRNA (uracil1498-N3)-methyltransferase